MPAGVAPSPGGGGVYPVGVTGIVVCMKHLTTRLAVLAVAPVAALVLSSCSSATTDESAGQESTATVTEQSVHNAADVTFVQNMIPHHEQAVEMATLAQANSVNPEVRALANAIIVAQAPEIQALRSWLNQWGEPETPDHMAHGEMAMEGMVDQAGMDSMQSLRGDEFDRVWLNSMIAHHEGAVTMSEAEIANGQNPEVTALAKVIISDQQAEVDHMNELLGE